MGRDDDIVALPQGMALGQRLGIGHVDPNAGEMLGLEPPHDGIEIVEAAAAYGDEVGALLQQLELFRSHHLVAHRRVGGRHEDDVGYRQNRVELVRFHHFLENRHVRNVFRVDPDHLHPMGPGAESDLSSDAAHPDHDGRPPVQLDPRVGARLPQLLLFVEQERMDPAREREKHGHRVVGDLRSLDDPVVGEHDLAVAQVGSAGEMQNALDAGAHCLHPPKLLAGANLLRRDLANQGICVADLPHDALRRHRHNPCRGGHALQLLQQRGIGVVQ